MMAPLPKMDLDVIWIKDLLHRGMRDEALARIKDLMESGRAGDQTRKLAEYFANAKKGRQPFGVKHLWYDIGRDNDDLREQGVSHADRMKLLSRKYRVNDESKFRTWIAQYERMMEEIAQINAENS